MLKSSKTEVKMCETEFATLDFQNSFFDTNQKDIKKYLIIQRIAMRSEQA